MLVVLLGGVGTFLVVRAKSQPSIASTSTQQGQNTPTTNRVTPASTQGSTTPRAGATSKLNQPVQAGANWVVTITRIDTTTSSDFPPKAGDTYLEISLSMKNVSAHIQPVSSLVQFTLNDANGQNHQESLTDSNIRQPADADVPAGKTLNAQIAYEVPASQHSFTLTFDYGLIDGSNASVSWLITD